MEKDRIDGKHYEIATRMIERGGRRDISLGTRECQSHIEPCEFGEGEGFYDEYGETSFGLMYHGFNYPDETGKKELSIRFWRPVMKNGFVRFIRPEECEIVKHLSLIHISEPKRLRRNSYAVFCLKKKK